LCAAFDIIKSVFSLLRDYVDTERPVPATLLELARDGSAEAFCELCRLYETPLLRHALALSGNLALAQDLTEETLVAAWKSISRYNGTSQFLTWLCSILIHQHRNFLRKKRAIPFSSLMASESENVLSHLETIPGDDLLPDQLAEAREQARLLRLCLEELPLRQREVIYLRFYVDSSLENVAEALDCSLGTVKSRLFHGLEKLRKMKIIRAQSESIRTNATPDESLRQK
jgi:RNA polymerase sigma-70 factor (ECF subfamily)